MPIAVDGPAMLTQDTERMRTLFHLEHEQRYGQAAIEEALEIVNLRLVLTAERADTRAETWLAEPWQPEAPVAEEMREVIFTNASEPVRTRVLWRPSLAAGTSFVGPAVIEEPNSTILVYPGDLVTVTPTGHLVIDIALDSGRTAP